MQQQLPAMLDVAVQMTTFQQRLGNSFVQTSIRPQTECETTARALTTAECELRKDAKLLNDINVVVSQIGSQLDFCNLLHEEGL